MTHLEVNGVGACLRVLRPSLDEETILEFASKYFLINDQRQTSLASCCHGTAEVERFIIWRNKSVALKMRYQVWMILNND